MRMLLTIAALAWMATVTSAQVEDGDLAACSPAELAALSHSIDGI